MSFTQKVIAGSSVPIHYLHGVFGGVLECYYYIMCPERKFAQLQEKFGKEEVNLHDYGVIVASGYGKKPTPQVREMLKEKYGFTA